MAEQFYTILTKIGKAKIANTSALGSKLNLAKFQVGDSNGSYYNPTEEQTELKHKVWEGPISSITIDENNPNWIVLQTMLPGDIGGFMIREAGVFDDEGNLIAIGKYPETYKPVTSEGSSKDLVIKMILEVSNASSVTLKIDPTVILATKKDIEILENTIKNIKVPVTKVNGKIGDVVLTAEDIKCKNGTTIETSLDDLKTKDKSLEDNINNLDTKKVNNTDYSKLNLYVGTTTGTSTAYIGTVNNGQKNYVDGQQITLIPHIDCGDNPAFNLNGIGAVNLVNSDGNLKAGDLKANMPYTFVRVGNNFFIRSNNDGIKLPKSLNGNLAKMDNLKLGSGKYNSCLKSNYIYYTENDNIKEFDIESGKDTIKTNSSLIPIESNKIKFMGAYNDNIYIIVKDASGVIDILRYSILTNTLQIYDHIYENSKGEFKKCTIYKNKILFIFYKSSTNDSYMCAYDVNTHTTTDTSFSMKGVYNGFFIEGLNDSIYLIDGTISGEAHKGIIKYNLNLNSFSNVPHSHSTTFYQGISFVHNKYIYIMPINYTTSVGTGGTGGYWLIRYNVNNGDMDWVNNGDPLGFNYNDYSEPNVISYKNLIYMKQRNKNGFIYFP